MMNTANAVVPVDVVGTKQIVNAALATATQCHQPFLHWEIANVLPQKLIDQMVSIHLSRPDAFVYDGTRASDSKIREQGTPVKRMFVDQATAKEYAFFQQLVDCFLSETVLQTVREKYHVDTTGLYLRVEYINDYDGFFLDPHLDIKEKRFTLFVYLNEGPAHMGTDLYDAENKLAKTVAFVANHGYIFLPGDDTWHGLQRKPIPDRRCSLLVNYVTFPTCWPVDKLT